MTTANFCAGHFIHVASEARKKKWLIGIVVFNLGMLCFFKYYNFFLGSLDSLVGLFGMSTRSLHLHVILPIGISFYTFLVMTYTIDIYRGTMKPTRSFLEFSVFVAFFPQLLAGPITRAKELLPQIGRVRNLTLEKFETGCWLVFWGLFKKAVIAENMLPLVDRIFENSASASLSETYVAALAFTIQIYCDFSGYTDMARGCARLLGFELMRNFDLPYFSMNPREFWRRWHISLSTWLRDYLYIPLGGNKSGRIRTYVNLFLTMVLGGLWHGASWNYVFWGAYHGLLLIGHRLIFGERRGSPSSGSRHFGFWKRFAMFHGAALGWLMFRSNRMIQEGGWGRDDSLNQLMEFVFSFRNGLGFSVEVGESLLKIALFTLPLLIVDLLEAEQNNHYFMLRWNTVVGRAMFYGALVFCLLLWGVQSGESFIYFQF